jgi:hypothetical protein
VSPRNPSSRERRASEHRGTGALHSRQSDRRGDPHPPTDRRQPPRSLAAAGSQGDAGRQHQRSTVASHHHGDMAAYKVRSSDTLLTPSASTPSSPAPTGLAAAPQHRRPSPVAPPPPPLAPCESELGALFLCAASASSCCSAAADDVSCCCHLSPLGAT